MECPPGMVYQQCGPLCPQTCDNIGTYSCHGGCAEGCFCPNGQVLSNNRCIHPIACPGKFVHIRSNFFAFNIDLYSVLFKGNV